MAASDERQQKLRERVVWLEAAILGLRRNYARSPLIASLGLLAIPAGLVGGGFGAFYVAFMVAVLVGVWIYVAWSHLHENEAELKAVREELRRLEGPPAER